MNAFASDVLESCFASVPTEEERADSARQTWPFQAVKGARGPGAHSGPMPRVRRAQDGGGGPLTPGSSAQRGLLGAAAAKGGLQAAFGFASARGDAAATATANDHAPKTTSGCSDESASQKNDGTTPLVLDAPAPDASLAGAVAAAGRAIARGARGRRATEPTRARVRRTLVGMPPAGSETALAAQKAGLLTTVDRTDDSVFGVTTARSTCAPATRRADRPGVPARVRPTWTPRTWTTSRPRRRGLRAAEARACASSRSAPRAPRQRRCRGGTAGPHGVDSGSGGDAPPRAALGADAEARYESRATRARTGRRVGTARLDAEHVP